jgi:hypothetical protein
VIKVLFKLVYCPAIVGVTFIGADPTKTVQVTKKLALVKQNTNQV